MFSEPDSDRAWARHNSCSDTPTSRNVSAVFRSGGVRSTGVSTHHVFGGCPATAPVEWYETHGAGHCGTAELDGAPLVEVVLGFFESLDSQLRRLLCPGLE